MSAARLNILLQEKHQNPFLPLEKLYARLVVEEPLDLQGLQPVESATQAMLADKTTYFDTASYLPHDLSCLRILQKDLALLFYQAYYTAYQAKNNLQGDAKTQKTTEYEAAHQAFKVFLEPRTNLTYNTVREIESKLRNAMVLMGHARIFEPAWGNHADFTKRVTTDSRWQCQAALVVSLPLSPLEVRGIHLPPVRHTSTRSFAVDVVDFSVD
jgi:hypothetical protein